MSDRFGRYQLLKRLAAGGMAEIWLARQSGVEGFEKLVVVKRILPHLAADPHFVTMLLDEARLAARFAHSNVVQIFDLGQAEGTYFIAMELVAGENLATFVRAASRARRPMPVTLAARVVSWAAQGLHYAHTRTDGEGRPLGVIHRDVSPQNILVSFEGQVKVVDFGIAKARSQVEQTASGVLKGKHAYMSPEQCRNQPLDARSDLFSLGIVLWELLTGARLFKRESALATLAAIAQEPVPAVRSRRPEVPLALEGIVDRVLQRDREARFATADELHRALEGFLHTSGAPVTSGDLAAYAGELLPEARVRWRRLLEARDRGEDLGTHLLAGLGHAGESAPPPPLRAEGGIPAAGDGDGQPGPGAGGPRRGGTGARARCPARARARRRRERGRRRRRPGAGGRHPIPAPSACRPVGAPGGGSRGGSGVESSPSPATSSPTALGAPGCWSSGPPPRRHGSWWTGPGERAPPRPRSTASRWGSATG